MIRLGLNTDRFSASRGCAMLSIYGTLIFKGLSSISIDYTLEVIDTLTLGEYCGIGNNVKIRCWDKITVGKGARIGVESQIFDTNFHYTRNVVTGKIYPHSKEIVIGDYVWIGNRTTIMKGTRLPDYSIVAGGSLLNNDYTQDASLYPTLAGVPAKVVASGNVRIFGIKEEAVLNDFFKNHCNSDFYQGDIGIVNEDTELHEFFQNL